MDTLKIEPTYNISYLRARDPSLMAGLLEPNFIPCKLVDHMQESEYVDSSAESQVISKEAENCIQIFLRLKKSKEASDIYKIENNVLICNVPNGSQTAKNLRLGDQTIRKYTFTHIFSSSTEQEKIFSQVVKQKVLRVINGENASILTYGTSGSGKTYTIFGIEDSPGIIPRSLEYMFRTLPRLGNRPTVKPTCTGIGGKILSDSDSEREIEARNMLYNNTQHDRMVHIHTYKKMQERISKDEKAILEDFNTSINVWISFAEIYNENIHDLLVSNPQQKGRPKLKLGSNKKHTYIKNLNCIHVTSSLEAYELLQYGLNNLNYAETCINDHSSRSHCIFTIKIVQSAMKRNLETIKVSYINFCDLAGAERSKKTMLVGARLRESNNINNSLVVLGRCISAIRDSQKQNKIKLAPFRESKLTQLLQHALSGQEALAMVVTINPILTMVDETMHVMNFSAIARDIVVERIEKPSNGNRFSEFLQGRSTTFGPMDTKMHEQHEQEMNFLQDTIEKLMNDIVANKQEANEVLDKVRKTFYKDVQRILKEADVRVEQTIDEYEEKIENLMNYHDMYITNQRSLNGKGGSLHDSEDVICLDDSDDEIKSQNGDVIEYALLRNDLFEAHLEIDSLKEQLMLENASIQILNQEIADLTQKYHEAEQAWDIKTELDQVVTSES